MTNREVPKRETPVSGLDLARALRTGHIMAWSSAPSDARLACAWAHAAIETKQGAEMTNYNFGHITPGSQWFGDVYFWGMVPEPVVPKRMFFRAYGDADQGAADYWLFIERKFAAALERFDAGDALGAARALKLGGYYSSKPNGPRQSASPSAHQRAAVAPSPVTSSRSAGSRTARAFAARLTIAAAYGPSSAV